MIPNSAKFFCILLCFLSLLDINGTTERVASPKQRRINSLVQYITEKAAKHQVMILIDEQSSNQTTGIAEFIHKISLQAPAIIMTINRAAKSTGFHKFTSRNPRETTLFIIVTFSDSGNLIVDLEAPLQMLSNLSNQYTRPKCLIVYFSQESDMILKEVFEKIWLKQFLDVTILQLANGNRSDDKIVLKNRVATLHQFNPYSGIYTVQKSWSPADWFPDKGNNLHKNVMKLLQLKLIKRQGLLFFRALASKLNFTIQLVKHVKGRSSDLIRQNAELLNARFQYYHNKQQGTLHRSYMYQIDSLKIVIPKKKVQFLVDLAIGKMVWLILINLAVIIVLRLLLMLLKFDSDSWQIMHIGGVLLGMSLPKVPRSTKERIVLSCLLLTCTVYSGFFHSMLTEVGIKPSHYQDINSIEELAASNLPLMVNNFVYRNFIDESIRDDHAYIKTLTKKLIIYKTSREWRVCMNDLQVFKNVACTVSFGKLIRLINWNYRQTQQELEIKMLDETLTFFGIIFIVKPALPIMENFNKKLMQFSEVGLMKKWILYESIRRLIPHVESIDEIQSNVFLKRILVLLGLGYILGIMIFVFEIAWHKFVSTRKSQKIQIRKDKKQRSRMFCLQRKTKKVNLSKSRESKLKIAAKKGLQETQIQKKKQKSQIFCLQSQAKEAKLLIIWKSKVNFATRKGHETWVQKKK